MEERQKRTRDGEGGQRWRERGDISVVCVCVAMEG